MAVLPPSLLRRFIPRSRQRTQMAMKITVRSTCVCVCARMRRRRRRPFRSPPLHLKGEGGGRGGGGGRSRQQQHRSMDRTLARTQRHLLLLAPISIGSRNKSLTPTITFPCLLRDLIVFTVPLLPCSTYTRRIFFRLCSSQRR